MNTKYRSELLKAAGVVRDLQDKLNAAIEESKVQTKPWLAKRREVLLKLAKAEMQEPLLNMQKMITESYVESIQATEDARRGGKRTASMRADSTEKLFQQQRAASMMRGLGPAETIEQFKGLVSVLSENEKQHKWIYEDVLKSMVRDKDYLVKVEKAIDEFRTPEEREAVKEMDAAAVFREHDKTLRNHLIYEAEQVAKGEGAAGHDWASLFDEMVQCAKRQASNKGVPDDNDNE